MRRRPCSCANSQEAHRLRPPPPLAGLGAWQPACRKMGRWRPPTPSRIWSAPPCAANSNSARRRRPFSARQRLHTVLAARKHFLTVTSASCFNRTARSSFSSQEVGCTGRPTSGKDGNCLAPSAWKVFARPLWRHCCYFVPRSVAARKKKAPRRYPEGRREKNPKGTVGAHHGNLPETWSYPGQLGRENRGPVRSFSLSGSPSKNRSASDLTDLRIEHLDIPGFIISLRCWSADRGQSFLLDRGRIASPRAGSLPGQRNPRPVNRTRSVQRLHPSMAVTVWGRL